MQGLPFRRVPKVIIQAMVEGSHKSLNQYSAKDGASEILSPLTIMTGKPRPDHNNLKIELGAYARVYEANDPTSTNKTRATGAIALTPTGNAQGGYLFMSLTTGRRLSRQQWTELPMPEGAIAAVEAMAEEQGQAIFEDDTPKFEWSPGVTITDAQDAPIIIHETANQGAQNQGAQDQGAGATSDDDDEPGDDESDELEDDESDGENEESDDDTDNEEAEQENDNNPSEQGEETDEPEENDNDEE
jgi:hypothetical protein